MNFFEGVTWGQTLVSVGVATLFSILTTLAIEYWAKPTLEVRKHKKLRDETLVDEILFKLRESRAALALVVEFDKFQQNGRIIPTRIHMLSRQLHHLHIAAAQIQEHLARLPKKYTLSPDSMKGVYESMSDLEAAAIKTKVNIDKNDYGEFRGRNQRILAEYLPKIDEALGLFGGKDER